MANLLSQNPLIIDTAAATAIITQPLRVTKIMWDAIGHATDDHALTIKDKNGVIKYVRTLTSLGTVGELVSAQESDFNPPLVVDGLIVSVLGGGLVYIYVLDNPPFKTT